MNDPVGKFVGVVEVYFPKPPKCSEEAQETAWMTGMVRALGRYEPEVLAAAAEWIITTRTAKQGRWFPLPSECREICDREARLLTDQATPLLGTRMDAEWSDDRLALAKDLIAGPMGREAARGGWLIALYDFARQHAALPKGEEIEGCKARSREFDAIYAELLADQPSDPTSIGADVHNALVRFAGGVKARHHELEEGLRDDRS